MNTIYVIITTCCNDLIFHDISQAFNSRKEAELRLKNLKSNDPDFTYKIKELKVY